ncbi:MAG: phage holin family protein [Limisphaerales bacterium]|jgi:putative membrane protein|nr:phage holin family protein [Verrucomicrobiota bacterium]
MKIFTLSRIITWAVNSLAVLVAANVVPGISYENNYITLILAALALGILNTLLKPVLIVLAFPLLMVTAGLFYFFINALLLLLVAFLVPSFHVDGFAAALFGGLIISFVSTFTNFIIGKKRLILRASQSAQSSPKQTLNNSDDDDNPVIDV